MQNLQCSRIANLVVSLFWQIRTFFVRHLEQCVPDTKSELIPLASVTKLKTRSEISKATRLATRCMGPIKQNESNKLRHPAESGITCGCQQNCQQSNIGG